jgi:hypothetical protein
LLAYVNSRSLAGISHVVFASLLLLFNGKWFFRRYGLLQQGNKHRHAPQSQLQPMGQAFLT